MRELVLGLSKPALSLSKGGGAAQLTQLIVQSIFFGGHGNPFALTVPPAELIVTSIEKVLLSNHIKMEGGR